MKDIGTYHQRRGPKRPLSEFFRSAGYQQVHDYLRDMGLPGRDIIERTQPHRGQPSGARVHPLLALEYLRWADFPAYCEAVNRLLDKRDDG